MLAENLKLTDALRRQIEKFCQDWKIEELAFFGSVLRNDFSPDSDVDLLVRFKQDANHGMFDLVQMEEKLSSILERPIDLVTYPSIEQSNNWLRKKTILESAEQFYAA